MMSMPHVSRDVLLSRHPHWDAMQARWKRYRALAGCLDEDEAKREWLPKGKREGDDIYRVRLKLSHLTGMSRPALRRMAGTLTRTPGRSSYEGSTLSSSVQQRLAAFEANADGAGRSLASFWGDWEPEVLRMGSGFVEVARAPLESAPRSAAEEPIPYLTTWRAEECVDWDYDDTGALLWAVLRREATERSTWSEKRSVREFYRVLTRTHGYTYEVSQQGGQVIADQEWEHGLGLVPLVPCYARRIAPMHGESYVDELTLADLRVFQLDSDQQISSYLHASPLLKLLVSKPEASFIVGADAFVHLNPQADENAEYLQLDTGGMQVREDIIARTRLTGMNAAGIDPNAMTEQSQGRSGVSIAWSFSTAEQPTLNALSEEMDAADALILEIVTRYLTPGQMPGPEARLWDGAIERIKQWDRMADEQLIELTSEAEGLVRSAAFARAAAKQIAPRIVGHDDPELLRAIGDEIDASTEFDRQLPAQSFGDPVVGIPDDGDATQTDEDDE